MKYNDQAPVLKKEFEHSGKVGWVSPSNIALVKYWGKHGVQLPRNPSISLTLEEAHTETCIEYKTRNDGIKKVDLSFLFEGKSNKPFQQKMEAYLEKYSNYIPWIKDLHLSIESKNSFPHSSGIASSASSMSALAMCLSEIESKLFGETIDKKRASFLSRLLSGSASRSVYPKIGLWGKHKEVANSNDDYAIPYWEEVDDVFHSFQNDILIVSNMEKSVSSRAGHKLMETNIYASSRYKNAENNLSKIIGTMRTGELMEFGSIVEEEALNLHALMMCSSPSYILLEPNTLRLIKEIQSYRSDTQLPIFFTLDAGPNIHLLYPENIKEEVRPFIRDFLQPLCLDGHIINDRVGDGPQKI